MLLVFNLDSSVTNDDLHQIFGIYGEIKEVMYFFCFNIVQLVILKLEFKFFYIMIIKSILSLIPKFDLDRYAALNISVITNPQNFMMLELLKLLFMPQTGVILLAGKLGLSLATLEVQDGGYYLSKLSFVPIFIMSCSSFVSVYIYLVGDFLGNDMES